MSDPKTNALEAVLLFYQAPAWRDEERQRWKELTGTTEATTRNLADVCRKALGIVLCPSCRQPLSVKQSGEQFIAWCGTGSCASELGHNMDRPIFGTTEFEAKENLANKIREELEP